MERVTKRLNNGKELCIDGVELRDKHFGTVLFDSAEEAEQALAKMKEGV